MRKKLICFATLLITLFSTTFTFAQNSAVDMNNYITLLVTQGAEINLNILLSDASDEVKIVSGSVEQNILNDGQASIIANSDTIRVYGKMLMFDCSDNGASISSVDASQHTELAVLVCSNNGLTSVNINGCFSLQVLNCSENSLTNLNLDGCPNLQYLECWENPLTSLDFSHCPNIMIIDCSECQISNINLSGCTALETLYCYENQLSSADISTCSSLRDVDFDDNNFSSLSMDEIFCQLPERNPEDEAIINVALDPTDEIIWATNKDNATNKNWRVTYYNETENEKYDFPATNGTRSCQELSNLTEIPSMEISIYPNPAKNEIIFGNVFNELVEVFDSNGRLVRQEIIREKLNIEDLSSGVYYIRIKDVTKKLIKE
ncbi:MAG: leucine-rich repeat domain-containing protein [Bacteroidota bacterium]|nr:leucine-rich repeat domain-containing protein [Bacteroidota bacterium]